MNIKIITMLTMCGSIFVGGCQSKSSNDSNAEEQIQAKASITVEIANDSTDAETASAIDDKANRDGSSYSLASMTIPHFAPIAGLPASAPKWLRGPSTQKENIKGKAYITANACVKNVAISLARTAASNRARASLLRAIKKASQPQSNHVNVEGVLRNSNILDFWQHIPKKIVCCKIGVPVSSGTQ